jgi:hypothetical protein
LERGLDWEDEGVWGNASVTVSLLVIRHSLYYPRTYNISQYIYTYFKSYLIIIPFSMEKLSVGKPQIFQSRIWTASPSVLVTEKSSEQGILISLHCDNHRTDCS